ncbi:MULTISPECIES: TOMM precursor leader peptide-binding protein [unclassified Streptomyces]|uniref:TOMM precursor leader peptide-binding protein n=1 Tax=unclassified Streptomyces TaxID=2593676 RepID=UPI0036CB9FCC
MTDPRLLILTAGAFGAAVAEGLGARHPGTTVLDVSQGTHPSLWPDSDLIVLAAGQDREVLADMVDASAHAWKRPWFPVQAGPLDLRCGPVVVPGRTACHRCYTRRRAQHTPPTTDRTTGADTGAQHVSGYAPHHVAIAVGLAGQAVREALAGPGEPGAAEGIGGTVRVFGLVEGTTSSAAVVAVDRCDRCRPARTPESRLTTFVELAAELAALPAR